MSAPRCACCCALGFPLVAQINFSMPTDICQSCWVWLLSSWPWTVMAEHRLLTSAGSKVWRKIKKFSMSSAKKISELVQRTMQKRWTTKQQDKESKDQRHGHFQKWDKDKKQARQDKGHTQQNNPDIDGAELMRNKHTVKLCKVIKSPCVYLSFRQIVSKITTKPFKIHGQVVSGNLIWNCLGWVLQIYFIDDLH